MSESEEKPKLIIDEDWKTQVEREKETLRKQNSETGQGEPEARADEASPTVEAETAGESDEVSARGAGDEVSMDDSDLPPPPPASFPFLVSMLGTQALAAMGQLVSGAEAPTVRLDYAKHYIDLLGLLEEKTKGNLSAQEYDLLADWLHQLRMAYVEVAKRK